jgi:phosphoglycerate dehydrogenase-like enzyme
VKPIVVVQGTENIGDIPRLSELVDLADLRFASSPADLRKALPGAEVMLGWNFQDDSLRKVWDVAKDLRWIHWCGAGVDAALFPELIESTVCVTNARRIFDEPMAEWVLGMILNFAKKFPETLEFQLKKEWNCRVNETIAGKSALVVGIGSIGRAIGRRLQNNGMTVEAVGRSARDDDPDFGHIYSVEDLRSRLPEADYVVLISPYTEQTHNLFGRDEFSSMASHARFINLSRGELVNENALLAALNDGKIAGAALDVFVDEPLSSDSPFWRAPNCLVSPHMSSYFIEYTSAMADQFLENWALYISGKSVLNIVDKSLGFVPSDAP